MDKAIQLLVEGGFDPNVYVVPTKGGFRIKGEPDDLVFKERSKAVHYLTVKFLYAGE